MEEKLALEMQVVALANQLNRAKEEIDDLKKRNKLLQESNSKLAELKRQRALRELQALKAIRAQLTGARLNKT